MSRPDPPQVLSWGEFASVEPDLAAFGADRLTAAPAYLATIRRAGMPRVHPVTPIFTPEGFYLYMEPTSPKARDLEERRLYSVHSGVPDNAGTGGEFSVSGTATPVEDADLWSAVAKAASYTPADRYVLFEFLVSEARCHGYGDVPLPTTKRWALDA
jgi:hypothetical protein